MEDRGYTCFGEVLYRILKQRGASQSALARQAQERGLDAPDVGETSPHLATAFPLV